MSAAHVAILVEARERIATVQNTYICFAIGNSQGTSANRDQLKMWVSGLLGESSSYSKWMKAHHPKLAAKMTYDDLLQGRLQWIDWMIEYWEAK